LKRPVGPTPPVLLCASSSLAPSVRQGRPLLASCVSRCGTGPVVVSSFPPCRHRSCIERIVHSLFLDDLCAVIHDFCNFFLTIISSWWSPHNISTPSLVLIFPWPFVIHRDEPSPLDPPLSDWRRPISALPLLAKSFSNDSCTVTLAPPFQQSEFSCVATFSYDRLVSKISLCLIPFTPKRTRSDCVLSIHEDIPSVVVPASRF